MIGRYELIDSHHPDWRGARFTNLARAVRELAASQPAARFYLFDRLTRERI